MMYRCVFWDYAIAISQSGRQKAGKERDWKRMKLRAQFTPSRSKFQLYIWSRLEQLWVSTSGSSEHWLMQKKQSAMTPWCHCPGPPWSTWPLPPPLWWLTDGKRVLGREQGHLHLIIIIWEQDHSLHLTYFGWHQCAECFADYRVKHGCGYLRASVAAGKHYDQRAILGGKGLFGLHFRITVDHQKKFKDRNSSRVGSWR